MPQSVDPSRFRTLLARNIALPLGLAVASAAVFVSLIAYLVTAAGRLEHSDQVIARSYALQKLDLEMESALRGYLLSGDEKFLSGYAQGAALTDAERDGLRELLAGDPQQQLRLERIRAMQGRWDRYADAQIARKRADPVYQVGSGADEGKRLKDAVRSEFVDLVESERRLRQDRNARIRNNTQGSVIAFVVLMLAVGGVVAWRGRSDLLELSHKYAKLLQDVRQQAAELADHAWLRESQAQLVERLARERQLGGVGHAALEFLAARTGAQAAVLYLPQADGFQRIAAYGPAMGDPGPGSVLPQDRTLVAEAARQRQPIRLEPVPPGYLQVASGLGQATAASVLVAPVEHEGRLCAVLELGFLRPLQASDGSLVAAVADGLGAALDAAVFRDRLQDALAETQQLNEELQAQQEELRTANEELEEQSRALKESQANLENQQAELEQTNHQLAEQTRRLAEQRDALRATQGELEARADELQRASRYKSEFLANMSHELRTPLNSSLILARLLADNPQGNLSGEQVKFAESIHAAGNDLLTLINDILDIAKVEAGKLEVRPEAVPVASVVDALRSLFEPLAADKGLQLAMEVAPDTPAGLTTDRARLEQILKNLLSNAVKFTEQGSVALLVGPAAGGLVRFEVRDSGIGIDASQHEVIFEAFRQADGTDSRRYGGTGLGLSISRDLARLLGGELSVQSAPGQGSTFTLALPVHYDGVPLHLPIGAAPVAPVRTAPRPSEAPAPTARPAPAFPDDRGRPAAGATTVLVIEDDPVFARILFDLAHEMGFRCLVAHHAEEGVALAREQQPHAVLLDVRLPDDTGLTVLQRLKDDPATRHLPVHVVSVEDQAETALQLGAVGYAVKPATREQLRGVFRRLEDKLNQKVKRVLLVEDDARQRESISHLIGDEDVQITAVAEGAQALQALAEGVYDCMVIDLTLPDMSGQELLRRMTAGESRSFPPVVVYTGRNLSRDEEAELLRYSRSIIIKGARSPERLLDEVTLFLHRVEADLSSDRQKMLRAARSREKAFEARRILVVDDDVRNIFALTSALEHKGAEVAIARNGVEALARLHAGEEPVDLVLMDLMMPEMDGYTAIREIRRQPAWQKLPIIAVTAKAMRDDQERCLAAGANDYLAKPIELERLFSLMRVWMPKVERL